MLKIVAL